MRKTIGIAIVAFSLVGCSQVATLRQSAPVSQGAGVVHQIAQQGDGSLWVTITPPQPLGQSLGITLGPDGKMWFTQDNLHSVVGKIDMSGKVVEYPVSAVPLQIIQGADGDLWFIEIDPGAIAKITTSGKLTEYPFPDYGGPSSITAGADGHIWITQNNERGVDDSIDKVALDGAITAYNLPHPKHRHSLFGIAGGPNQSVWFTDQGTNEIGSVTTRGHFTIFTIPTPNSGAAGIALGADGNLYFAESIANKIGEVDRFGNITEYPVPASDKGPRYISEGYSGGSMWFDDQDATTGNYQFRQFIIATKTFTPVIPPPYASSVPQYLNFGPDGNMWIADARGPILVALTHVMTSTPASLVFSGVGQSQTIQIHETQYKVRLFTAKSSNQNVATVSDGNQSNSFIVTSLGAGSCAIHVRDDLGNFIDVGVTVQ
jgi:virginiamycin B lyase